MTKYHLIPHSHWDREWYLTFDEFRAMLVHMIDDLLEIIDRDPAYRFFLLDGQTSVVDDYLDVRPDRKEVLAELVAKGRLGVGPWYVLPDSFLVSGEALIRNLMIGKSAAAELGSSGFTGYIPDSFGHTAQIPQILRGFGIDTAITFRGFGGEPGQEGSEYRWQAPDGSAVLMEHLHAGGYSEAYFPSSENEDVVSRFEAIRKKVDPRATTPARLLLSGGDHHWPTATFPEVIETLNEHLAPEAEAIHSDLGTFFEDLKHHVDMMSLPMVDGEMRFGYRWAYNVTGGVYSARMYIKQANARCQRLLERILEPLNAIAVSRGAESQLPLLRHGWKTLLQNHPHDSICGCSIDPVHREMMTRFEKVESLGKAFCRFAWLSLLEEEEGVAADDQAIVVYNSTSVERDDVCRCAVDFYKQDIVVGLNPDVVVEPPKPPVEGFRLQDAEGNNVPFEVVNTEDHHAVSLTRNNYPSEYLSERFHIAFEAKDVPPLGFKTFRVVRQTGFGSAGETSLNVGPSHIENAYLRVESDARGRITIIDRSTGSTYGPVGVLEDGGDAGDEYNWSPPRSDSILRSDATEHSVEVRKSAFAAELVIRGLFEVPAYFEEDGHTRSAETVAIPFETVAYLHPGDRLVRFRTVLENGALDHRLRVLFDTGCDTNLHSAESAFAMVEREQRHYDREGFSIEVPAAVASMQRFVMIDDGGKGAAIISDGLPEYEHVYDSGGVVALTLLRCVGQLSRGDLIMRPGGQSGWHNECPEAQCLGVHTFDYAFLPYRTPWDEEGSLVLDEAARFTEPLVWKTSSADESPVDGVFLARTSPSTLSVTAAKEAEDGGAIVIRVANSTPLSVDGKLQFGWQPAAVFETTLDETPGREIALSNTGSLHATWAPFEIKSFLAR